MRRSLCVSGVRRSLHVTSGCLDNVANEWPRSAFLSVCCHNANIHSTLAGGFNIEVGA